jgi:hypothetical protein
MPPHIPIALHQGLYIQTVANHRACSIVGRARVGGRAMKVVVYLAEAPLSRRNPRVFEQDLFRTNLLREGAIACYG